MGKSDTLPKTLDERRAELVEAIYQQTVGYGMEADRDEISATLDIRIDEALNKQWSHMSRDEATASYFDLLENVHAERAERAGRSHRETLAARRAAQAPDQPQR